MSPCLLQPHTIPSKTAFREFFGVIPASAPCINWDVAEDLGTLYPHYLGVPFHVLPLTSSSLSLVTVSTQRHRTLSQPFTFSSPFLFPFVFFLLNRSFPLWQPRGMPQRWRTPSRPDSPTLSPRHSKVSLLLSFEPICSFYDDLSNLLCVLFQTRLPM